MFKKWILAITLSVMSVLTFAAATGEDAKSMVEEQAEVILAKLGTNAGYYRQNPDAFAKLINQEVLPYLDVDLMSRIVLGRHWNTATAQQQQAFTDAFTDLLIRVYSKGWTSYTGASVNVLGTPEVDKYQRANVRAQVIDNSKQKSMVIFSVRYDGNRWKVYDANFEGVSILTSYRNSFNTEINNGGLDALINKIGGMNPQ